MGVMKTLVLAALCATAAYAGSAGEGEHAARLEARVDAALERMLGPGRAAATVEVRGERVTKREEIQISGTGGHEAPPESDAAILDLPGYTNKAASRNSPAPSESARLVHSDSEETIREASFAASGVRAWLFLDKKLDDAVAADAVHMSLEILGIDPDRGDSLNVVRTSFPPVWRAAFSHPRDARALALLAVAAAALLLAAALIGRAATRSSRALAEAIVKARPAACDPALRRPSAPLPPMRRISPLPPLEKGGPGP